MCRLTFASEVSSGDDDCVSSRESFRFVTRRHFGRRRCGQYSKIPPTADNDAAAESEPFERDDVAAISGGATPTTVFPRNPFDSPKRMATAEVVGREEESCPRQINAQADETNDDLSSLPSLFMMTLRLHPRFHKDTAGWTSASSMRQNIMTTTSAGRGN